jgi:hypothetical protein
MTFLRLLDTQLHLALNLAYAITAALGPVENFNPSSIFQLNVAKKTHIADSFKRTAIG